MNTRTSSGSIQVSLRALAVASLLVSMTALATLVIVVSVTDADALSTVAMALAILAFVVQLIVYVVQSAESSTQAQLSQELHGRLISILAQIEERTQGTQKSMDQMNSRLLEAAIGKAQAEGLSAGTEAFAERVADSFPSPGGSTSEPTQATDDRSEPPQSPPPSSSGVDWPGPLEPSEASRLHRKMATWPTSEQAKTIQEILSELSESDIDTLARVSRDAWSSTDAGATLGPGISIPNVKLVSLGLVEKIPGWRLHTLTEKGEDVGRIFTAAGPPPAGFEDVIRIRIAQEARTAARNVRYRNREF